MGVGGWTGLKKLLLSAQQVGRAQGCFLEEPLPLPARGLCKAISAKRGMLQRKILWLRLPLPLPQPRKRVKFQDKIFESKWGDTNFHPEDQSFGDRAQAEREEEPGILVLLDLSPGRLSRELRLRGPWLGVARRPAVRAARGSGLPHGKAGRAEREGRLDATPADLFLQAERLLNQGGGSCGSPAGME